jgi:hypothetical protein
MQIAKIWKTRNETIGKFSTLSFCLVLHAGIAYGAFMQAPNAAVQSPVPSTGWTPIAAAPHDITVRGAIRQVVPTHLAGSPAGVHILIDSLQGSFDASLGSYLPSEVQQALSNGEQVQVTGVVRTANGKDYLFASQLSVAGHQLTIRNPQGFLVHPASPTASNKMRSERVGGIQ